MLKGFGASQSQAESVAEAIIRHQDLGETGMITSVGQLIQLATVFGKLLSFSVAYLHLRVSYSTPNCVYTLYIFPTNQKLRDKINLKTASAS